MSNLSLAVTNIGDLLLHDKISFGMDGKPIDCVRLTIPEYQRPYKWTACNALQLLDDIIEARNNNKEVYRVGTLILHRDSDGNYNIVDGQQRTITFALLLHALYRGQCPPMSLLQQKVFNNKFSRHNIPNNLLAFQRRLAKHSSGTNETLHDNNLTALRNFIESQCELIVVITDDQAEAFQFFDSQNARGKALYPHDLLKAYHLREMADVDETTTEKIVKEWEKIEQAKLSEFFGEYLYRLKEWIEGDWAYQLTDQNIYKFKGVTRATRTPYAQFYKSAYSYAEMVNSSNMPYVTGTREIKAFQLDTPIIAGKPFFEYTRHYFEILHDVRNNDLYEGFYIKGDEIVKTLDKYFRHGVGNGITRLLFDTALLLFVDRFCPPTFPSQVDIDTFNQFVTYAFVWAYSLRAQYVKLGWHSAQNFLLELDSSKVNSLNIYKLITKADSPLSLLNNLADRIVPLTKKNLASKLQGGINENKIQLSKVDDENIPTHYLHFFQEKGYYND